MPSKTWKVAERRLAGFFGSTRRPLSGGNDKRGRDDSLHPRLFLEAKHGKTQMLWNLYLKTRDLAVYEKRIPVLGLFLKNHPGFLVVVHSSQLQAVAREQQILLPKKKRPLRVLDA